MDSKRWEKIERLFHEAREIAPDSRHAFLGEACEGDEDLLAEVEALLDADEGCPLPISRSIREEAGGLLEDEAEAAWAGKTLGPWRITGLLGQGGMGAVYSAVRDDAQFEQHAAIKVLRLGMLSPADLGRFRRERRIVARLEHPNIARLLDGGEIESDTSEATTPYIVLELVEGRPISQYSIERGLGLREKLQLFLQVLDAVEYAHQKLVLHRDIKPSNILVTPDGTSKLLDFGVAKLLEGDASEETAQTTQMILTPEYASPEQIRGEPLSAATDIYSLGVVLYELLGGRRPYTFRKTDALETARVICEVKGPPLGLGKDIDTLLAKAMEKDPARRYASVSLLAQDIRRYLAGMPLLARKSSFGYRLAKFLGRNRLAAALAAVAVISLVGGLAFSIREARRAKRSAVQVRQLANTFVFEVHDAIAKLPGATQARELVISRALRYVEELERESPGDADLQYELATAYKKIADVTGHVTGANLGDTRGALAHFQKAQRLFESALEIRPEMEAARFGLVEVLKRQGQSYAYAGDRKQANDYYRRALTAAEAFERGQTPSTEARLQLSALLMSISDLQRPAGDSPGAMESSGRALKILRALHQERPADTEVKHSLAGALSATARSKAFANDLKGASEARRESIELMEEVSKTDPDNAAAQRDLLVAYGNLGDLLGSPTLPSLGDRAGAEDAYRKAVSIAQTLADADPRNQRAQMDLAIALSRLGHVVAQGQAAEALAIYERALTVFRTLAAKDPNNASVAVNMASMLEMKGERLVEQGDLSEAARTFRESRASCRGILDRKPGEATAERVLIRTLAFEVDNLVRMNRREEASIRAREALELAASTGPGKTPQYTGLMKARANAIMAVAAIPRDACRWRLESLKWWQSIEKDPTFNVLYQRERDRTAQAAAACR